VIDAMDEYQNIDRTRWTRCSSSRSSIRKAASVSIGCKISKGRTAAWWTRVCCDPPETQEAYEVHAQTNLASDWELCSCASRRTKR
jgi:hypothetical protein